MLSLFLLVVDCCNNGDSCLDNVLKQLTVKDFVITQGTYNYLSINNYYYYLYEYLIDLSNKLQSHAHWMIEMAIKYASRTFHQLTNRVR